MASPDISLVVPSHDRPVRLRWLLNALEDQTLPRERFEVIVVHDSSGAETEDLLRTHPLAADGTLRHIRFAPGPAAAPKRNAGWRAACAPVVAFTDDDCRPPREWLARLLEAAERNPGSIVQGKTVPDPDEELLLRTPDAHTQTVDPPSAAAETCNIAYPRELLERLGGQLEDFAVGEDTDLALRASALGTPIVAAAEAVTYHAVETAWLPAQVRATWRWRDMPLLVRRHPEHRREFAARIFWRPSHAWLALAILATPLARRPRLLAALLLPWAIATWPRYGATPRGVARSVSELPRRAVLDGSEMAVLAYGSARHRSLLL